ncbi:MAG: YlxR family protein [Actinomycetota bacterium]|nr:YlxR family protein [Actinomycetota bacterium]
MRLALVGRTVVVDPPATLPGRGAYLCSRPACWEVASRRDGARIARALRRRYGQVQMNVDPLRAGRRWHREAVSPPRGAL